MKIRKRDFEIFNLSFLDVISCGFAAVVLLVLISNTKENPAVGENPESFLEQIIATENRISALQSSIAEQQRQNRERKQQQVEFKILATVLKDKTKEQKKRQEQLNENFDGLSLVQETLNRVSITPTSSKTVRDKEVGGIPVDSDYVIFIVDISGSMQQIWGRVSREVVNVLNIHPKVEGFQILNDNGNELIKGYAGRWMPDTDGGRKRAMRIFRTWSGLSDSNPVGGIEKAIKKYGKPGRSLSIYIFGDDYTGGSYDTVINRITKLNRNKISGKRIAKIHAVAFQSPHTTDRFAILMRELTKRNAGAFLALKP